MSNTQKDPKNNTATDADGDEEEAQDQTPQSAEDKKLNAGLTQVREEREVDAATAQQAFKQLQALALGAKSNKLANDPSVEIKKEDLQFLMSELELSKEQADALLRQHKGALMPAIRSFLAQ
jgi:hypothetical protein